MKRIIKRHRNRNSYALTEGGHWVRDYTKAIRPVDINNLMTERDNRILVENEISNSVFNLARIDSESIYCPNCVIVSDGYKFAEKSELLQKLSDKKVTVIGVNRSLAKWQKGKMDYYVVNNPYSECMSFLPSNNYYPRCVASRRTYPGFIYRYRQRRGVLYQYTPVISERLASINDVSSYRIDDYRNPICAAISMAYRWGVERLALVCCDDCFEGERPGAEAVNGLWMYPQHKTSQWFVDGNLYWLKQFDKNIKVVNHSAGMEYKEAEYISADDLLRFF